jgi:putative ABC transport system permease protein
VAFKWLIDNTRIDTMLKNYFISAARSIKRYKLFTFLNVFGLSTGLACSILIFLWVQDERSYDKFNDDAPHLFRIVANVAGTPAAVTPPPIAPALKQQIPAVHSVTRVVPFSTTIAIGNTKFDEKNVLYADSNFLEMFNFPLFKGNKSSVLSQPNGIVITAATATKYFGTTDAVGKIIHVDNDINGNNYTVTGVLKNIPHNSHLQFDLLLPIDFYNKSNAGVWDNFAAYSYVRLKSNADISPAALAALARQTNAIYKVNNTSNTLGSFTFQPLTAIHLKSHLLLDVGGQGNSQHVTIFLLVAIFILLIACINFINLSTALGSQRAKEVGLRKTIGASRRQLVSQFMAESLVISVMSLILAIVIVWLLLPLFNQLTTKSISIDLSNVKVLGGLFLLTLITGFVSGAYPAIFMASFKPVTVLKGAKLTGGQGFSLRNALVVLQFAVSVILMVSTLIVNDQLNFILKRDIGFNKENLLYLPMPHVGDLQSNYQALQATLLQTPGISDYTVIDHLPTNLTTGTVDVKWVGKDPRQQTIFPHIGVDGRFIKTFGMHILAGRVFNEQVKDDADNYILNETAARVMGMTASTAIGKQISSNGHSGTIIGVVKDFNFKPVQQPIEPLIIKQTKRGGFIVLRTTTENTQAIINKLQTIFQKIYPNSPFSYDFVDQDLSRLYMSEQRMGVLFNIFSVVSIIVSCLGLFGLATFATQRRVKEIGVRKVLGAKTIAIVVMLVKDFIKPVSLSLLIAFPIAWYAMSKWLTNYAYRIQISWWLFVIAAITATLIAIFTISYQSIKAALTNPVKSLRNE